MTANICHAISEKKSPRPRRANPGRGGNRSRSTSIQHRGRDQQPKRQSLAVADGRLAVGTIVSVGATRWRAVDFQGRDIGVFDSLREAVAALPARGES